eukprot:1180555-Prorocentrum_minimum.AAC.5
MTVQSTATRWLLTKLNSEFQTTFSSGSRASVEGKTCPVPVQSACKAGGGVPVVGKAYSGVVERSDPVAGVTNARAGVGRGGAAGPGAPAGRPRSAPAEPAPRRAGPQARSPGYGPEGPGVRPEGPEGLPNNCNITPCDDTGPTKR